MPAKKKTSRPNVSRHIPESVSREVLTRAGHKCSACGESCSLERAHIVPFSETHDHTAGNLVCLCANCHTRADDPTTGWDALTMQGYRDDPWVNRSRRMDPATPRASGTPQNLPYLTLGPLFKGRGQLLTDLRATLTAQHPAVIRGAQAIHGMGGVGKTRAAVEYAWHHQHDYTALLFITADNPDSLQRNLAALCDPLVLDLPEHAATDIRVQLHAVLQWLQRKGWLLILDNVDTPEAMAAVTRLLPSLHAGHVLITSRLTGWPGGVTDVPIATLDASQAVLFLKDHTAGIRIVRDDDDACAAGIARQLGGLCLALEQATAWIKKNRRSFADYLAEREKTGVLLFKDYHQRGLNDYHQDQAQADRSLLITYNVSLAQLTPEARLLFDILSWLAPEPMPMQHLEKLTALPDPRGLLMELCDLHLATLSADGTTFSVHRLLQEITRLQQSSGGAGVVGVEPLGDRTAEAGTARSPKGSTPTSPDPSAAPPALLTALTWVNAEMPGQTDDVHTWPVAVPLLPHALALATTAAQRDLPTPTTRLLNECAILLQTQANYPAVEPLKRRALALAEKHLGENHCDTAIHLNNLAQLLQATNRLAEAEPLIRRALAIDEASFGHEHDKVAIDLNNLAMLLKATNRLAEAEPLMHRALAIGEASFGPDHPKVAIRLGNLAQLLQATNRLAEAEPLMRRALAIDEASFGHEHPYVAVRLNNLSTLLQATNRMAEAEPLMRRALAIDEASFGHEHPKAALRLNNLAQLLQVTNRLAEAEPLMHRALAIWENSLGRSHPQVAVGLNNLAGMLDAMGQVEGAENMFRRALAIDEASFGHDHPTVALRLNNLARLLQDTNRREEAEPMMARALRTLEDSLGSEHPYSVTVRENLAILREEMRS